MIPWQWHCPPPWPFRPWWQRWEMIYPLPPNQPQPSVNRDGRSDWSYKEMRNMGPAIQQKSSNDQRVLENIETQCKTANPIWLTRSWVLHESLFLIYFGRFFITVKNKFPSVIFWLRKKHPTYEKANQSMRFTICLKCQPSIAKFELFPEIICHLSARIVNISRFCQPSIHTNLNYFLRLSAIYWQGS